MTKRNFGLAADSSLDTGLWSMDDAAALPTLDDGSSNAATSNVVSAAGLTRYVRNDFNGDGTSDLLLKNGQTLVDWIMKDGAYQEGNVLGTIPIGFSVVGTGDFNGDGTTDILLQNGSTVVDWIKKNGMAQCTNVITTIADGWAVAGVGDFNGDGTSDVLLTGHYATVGWLMKDGVYSSGFEVGLGTYPDAFTDDYNGDGNQDFMNQFAGVIQDSFSHNGNFHGGNHIYGYGYLSGYILRATGDINGDGTADAIVQNGATIRGLILKDGGLQSTQVLTTSASGFTVQSASDLNGDGTSDLVLQGGGTVVGWIMKDGQVQSTAVIGVGADGWTVV